jgi:hypothetical protein
MFNEKVERVDVLLDQALDLQESRQKIPFVLSRSQIYCSDSLTSLRA